MGREPCAAGARARALRTLLLTPPPPPLPTPTPPDPFISNARAAERGFVDDVIAPRTTRARLCEELHMLQTKQWKGLDKKHGNIPL